MTADPRSVSTKALSERDICTKFITPALAAAGWDVQVQVRENVHLTKGRVIVRGKLVARGTAKFADYVLYARPSANVPLAIIEAKDNNHGVGDGMSEVVRGRDVARLLRGRGAPDLRCQALLLKEARCAHLQGSAAQPTIGKLVDDAMAAMAAIERDNPTLKGAHPKDSGRPGLDNTRLGELIDVVGTVGFGDASNRSRDVLGRVYELERILRKFGYPPDKQRRLRTRCCSRASCSRCVGLRAERDELSTLEGLETSGVQHG